MNIDILTRPIKIGNFKVPLGLLILLGAALLAIIALNSKKKSGSASDANALIGQYDPAQGLSNTSYSKPPSVSIPAGTTPATQNAAPTTPSSSVPVKPDGYQMWGQVRWNKSPEGQIYTPNTGDEGHGFDTVSGLPIVGKERVVSINSSTLTQYPALKSLYDTIVKTFPNSAAQYKYYDTWNNALLDADTYQRFYV